MYVGVNIDYIYNKMNALEQICEVVGTSILLVMIAMVITLIGFWGLGWIMHIIEKPKK